VVGRIGGDEFMVLLIGETRRDTVTAIAERISAGLHRTVQYGDRQLRLGATLGVAIIPDDIAEPERGIRAADEALVRAKREQRGGIGVATREDAAQLLRTASIIRALDLHASTATELPDAAVHLQPIVALKREQEAAPRIIAVEVLTRWSDPDIGVVPPDELFSAIGPERSARIGHAMREQALIAFAALRDAGLAEARVALNLSSNEVCRANIALNIAEQVERAGLSLRNVEIEITEEVLLDRVSDSTLNQLASLRGRGARLVLDDFGTGNSGLAQMLRLPLDGVKLDKQFIQRLGVDARAEEIVRATVSLAHSLGLEVVAEGIETEQQDAMARMLGCDAGQGYLYARPMPPDMLRAWLATRTLH
jgi:EAL domain-containing protein (putative c-di-GMP-specific phosphodiesterase class I)